MATHRICDGCAKRVEDDENPLELRVEFAGGTPLPLANGDELLFHGVACVGLWAAESMDDEKKFREEIARAQTDAETHNAQLAARAEELRALDERFVALGRVRGEAKASDDAKALSDVEQEIGRLADERRALLEA